MRSGISMNDFTNYMHDRFSNFSTEKNGYYKSISGYPTNIFNLR